MSILEIIEAHTCHTHTTPHSIGYWARCTCGWTGEGQQSHDYDFAPEHRAHVAQVLEQHEREAKAVAWEEGFQAGWEEHEDPGAFVNDFWDAKTPNPYADEATS